MCSEDLKVKLVLQGIKWSSWKKAQEHWFTTKVKLGTDLFSFLFYMGATLKLDVTSTLTMFLLLLQLASPPDPVSAAGQTATSWRARSSSSIWGRSRPRKANRCTAVWYVNKIQSSHSCLLLQLYSLSLWLWCTQFVILVSSVKTVQFKNLPNLSEATMISTI